MKSLDEILKMEEPNEYLYEYAYEYGRLEPKWEKLLLSSKDPYWLYWYTRYVIGRRWQEAEEYIKKNPRWAYWYALDIVENRWPEAEEYIMKDSVITYLYYKFVLDPPIVEKLKKLLKKIYIKLASILKILLKRDRKKNI